MDASTRLAIEHACRRLSITYAHAVDDNDADRFAALFADDGVLATSGRTVGRADIRRRIARRNPELRSRHVISTVLIDVHDEHTASGVSYLTLYRHLGAESGDPEPIELVGPAAVGEYRDRFVRVDGEWLFAERRVEFAFMRRDAFPDLP